MKNTYEKFLQDGRAIKRKDQTIEDLKCALIGLLFMVALFLEWYFIG